MHHWQIRKLDVKNAFFNSVLTEDVFMHQSEGFINPYFPLYVCKLNKALYSLKQTLRAWYDRLKGSLMQWVFNYPRQTLICF